MVFLLEIRVEFILGQTLLFADAPDTESIPYFTAG